MLRSLSLAILLIASVALTACGSQRTSTGPTQLIEFSQIASRQNASINPQLASLIESHQSVGTPRRKPPIPASRPKPQPAQALPAPVPEPKKPRKVSAPPVTASIPTPPPVSVPAASARAAPRQLSEDAIRKAMIRQSMLSYSGSCPCPYNTDTAGRVCGGRSACTGPGGASRFAIRKT